MPTPSPSNSPTRARRVSAVASVLTVIAVGAVVLALVVGANLPEAWWPRTGAAFAAETSSSSVPRQDPCTVIVGPAKEYCERGAASSPSSSGSPGQGLADAAWRLVPVAAGLAALVIWRRRSTLVRGRC